MPNIRLTEEGLSERLQAVRRLVRPLFGGPHGPAAWRPVVSPWMVTVVAAQRQNKDTQFRTYVPGVMAEYSETWEPSADEAGVWFLRKAYLSILRERPAGGLGKFVLLHCDPNEPTGQPHWEYKRGPHLHVWAAEAPIPHSHLALELGHVETVLQSPASLFAALERAIRMLKEQVLDQMTLPRQ